MTKHGIHRQKPGLTATGRTAVGALHWRLWLSIYCVHCYHTTQRTSRQASFYSDLTRYEGDGATRLGQFGGNEHHLWHHPGLFPLPPPFCQDLCPPWVKIYILLGGRLLPRDGFLGSTRALLNSSSHLSVYAPIAKSHGVSCISVFPRSECSWPEQIATAP